MTDAVGTHFGLVIAYVLPGFVTLWGLRLLSSEVDRWLSSPSSLASLDVVLFVTLASIACGMIVSAVRWLIVDSLLALAGIQRPVWDDGLLQERLQAFEAVVQAHYRYFQCYANTAVAIAFVFAVWRPHIPPEIRGEIAVGFVLLETILLITARDNLKKYYLRGSRILSLDTQIRKESPMSNGHKSTHPPKTPSQTTKTTSKKK